MAERRSVRDEIPPRTSRSGARPTRALAVAVCAAAVVLAASCGGSGGSEDAASSTTAPPEDPATTTPVTTTPRDSSPLVIAHRGASADAPEHTFAAYDRAVEQGANFIEQDLQMTADGQLVVLHDPVLDRTARGPVGSCTGPVAEKTLAQLGECDVGSWFNEAYPDRADPGFVGQRIPTMAEVLDRYGDDVRYYIELKTTGVGAGMEQPLLEVLDAAGLQEGGPGRPPVIVQSFGPDVLRTVHALRPELPLVLLLRSSGGPVDVATLDDARQYASAVGPPFVAVDAALVAAAHERCLDVHPYTVDDPVEMTRLLDIGVDGIFTNTPAALRSAVEGRTAIAPTCTDSPA